MMKRNPILVMLAVLFVAFGAAGEEKETVKVKAEEVKTNVQAKAAEVKVKAEEVKDKVKGKLNKNACGCTCEETAEPAAYRDRTYEAR